MNKDELKEHKEELEEEADLLEDATDEPADSIKHDLKKAGEDINHNNLKGAKDKENRAEEDIKKKVEDEISFVSSELGAINNNVQDKLLTLTPEKASKIDEMIKNCETLLNNAQANLDDDLKVAEESIIEAKQIIEELADKINTEQST